MGIDHSYNVLRGFGVDDDFCAGPVLARGLDIYHGEVHMNGTVAAPDQDPDSRERFLGEAAVRLLVVVEGSLLVWNSQIVGAVEAQMDVREEKNLLSLVECPFKNPRSIAGGAGATSGTPAEGFDAGGAVHIDHG